MLRESAPPADLAGRVALVTGGSRGIGRGIALALARGGADVAVNYRTAERVAADVVQAIQGAGRRALAVQADVAAHESVLAMVRQVRDHLGTVDILINNAGTATRATTMDLSEAEWDHVMAVNLKGAFFCAQAVVGEMINRKYGRIINISSIAGQTGGRIGPHYAASKTGMLGMTRFMARELAPHGITVNAVAPAGVPTDLARASGAAPTQAGDRPVGRAGTPEDIAAAVLFLAGEAAGYITGQTISANGGSWMA